MNNRERERKGIREKDREWEGTICAKDRTKWIRSKTEIRGKNVVSNNKEKEKLNKRDKEKEREVR